MPPDRTVHQPGGLFGIGCRVATHPPHNVQKMNGLKDAAGDSVAEVKIGDTLLTVGDVMLEELGPMPLFPPPPPPPLPPPLPLPPPPPLSPTTRMLPLLPHAAYA